MARRSGRGGFGPIRVIVEGHNHVHIDGFHSDLHAEMVVMNEFERDLAGPIDLSKHIMVTSLETCPMCMTRRR